MSQSRLSSHFFKENENIDEKKSTGTKERNSKIVKVTHLDAMMSLEEIEQITHTTVHLYAGVTEDQVKNLPLCVRQIVIHSFVCKKVISALPRDRVLRIETKADVSNEIKSLLASMEEPINQLPRFVKPTVDINPRKRKAEPVLDEKGEFLFIANKKSRTMPKPIVSKKHARDNEEDELETLDRQFKKIRLSETMTDTRIPSSTSTTSLVPSTIPTSPSIKNDRKREREGDNSVPTLFKKARNISSPKFTQKRARENEEAILQNKKRKIEKFKNNFYLKAKTLNPSHSKNEKNKLLSFR